MRFYFTAFVTAILFTASSSGMEAAKYPQQTHHPAYQPLNLLEAFHNTPWEQRYFPAFESYNPVLPQDFNFNSIPPHVSIQAEQNHPPQPTYYTSGHTDLQQNIETNAAYQILSIAEQSNYSGNLSEIFQNIQIPNTHRRPLRTPPATPQEVLGKPQPPVPSKNVTAQTIPQLILNALVYIDNNAHNYVNYIPKQKIRRLRPIEILKHADFSSLENKLIDKIKQFPCHDTTANVLGEKLSIVRFYLKLIQVSVQALTLLNQDIEKITEKNLPSVQAPSKIPPLAEYIDKIDSWITKLEVPKGELRDINCLEFLKILPKLLQTIKNSILNPSERSIDLLRQSCLILQKSIYFFHCLALAYLLKPKAIDRTITILNNLSTKGSKNL